VSALTNYIFKNSH